MLPQGIMVPLIAPKRLEEMPGLVDHVVQGGVSSIFILGTTGETLQLDQPFRLQIIKAVASYVGKRVPVLAGIASSSLGDSVELMKAAHEAGCAASVALPVLWQDDGIATVKDLLSSGPGPLLLYNNPMVTAGRALPIEQVNILAKEERIIGIKDSSGDQAYLAALLEIKQHRKRFQVYYGSSRHLSQVLRKEIDGLVSGGANVEPALEAQFWESKGEGLWPQWESLQSKIRQAGENHYIRGIKNLLKEKFLLSDD